MSDKKSNSEPQGRISVGERGERLAIEYLEAEGWTIREQNYTTKFGEIDIIAQRETTRGRGKTQLIAFVEVKTRSSTRRLPPEASVTQPKRRKISALARFYAKVNCLRGINMRFDVIAIDLSGGKTKIKHIPGAFDVLGRLR